MIKILSCTLVFVCVLIACSRDVDLVHEKQILQQLLQQERKAHFDKDIDLFISTFADSTISVYDGEVYFQTPDDNKKRFGPYFKSVEFKKWDDVIPPVIEISDDGSMAYAVIKKNIVLTYPDTLGNLLYDSTTYSWVTIYRKIEGEWKSTCNASTHK